MKHLNFLFAFLMAMLWGTGVANADVVQDYKLDFNASFDVSDHEFKVASGWGHIAESYYDDSEWETYWVTYTYASTSGVDGSGALKIGSQTLGSWGNTQSVNDLLVTPAVTGTSSIYVKKTSSSGTIAFYKVTKDESTGKFVKGDKISVTLPTLSTTDYVKVDIPAVDNEYIGIRGSYVYIDDFSAEQVDKELARSLKVTSVAKTTNTGYSVDCDESGNFKIELKTTVQNNGDVTLNPGDENYSLSVIAVKDNSVLGTKDIDVALAPGESAEFNVTGIADYETYKGYLGYTIKENVSNTVSTSKQWYEPVPYAPAMEVRTSDNSKVDAGENFPYGMVQEATSKTFTLRSTGAAPLVVTSVTLPDGFTTDLEAPFTLDAHAERTFSVTMTAATTGVFSGNVTFHATGIDDFSFGVSGTVLDPSKFYVDFEDNAIPAGAYAEGSWKVAQRDYASGDNVYILTNGSQNATDKFVTPLLRVAEGEKMTVDVARTYYSTAGDGVYLKVYYSANRRDWTLAREIKSTELSSVRAVSYTYTYGKYTNFVIDNIPAGDYYVAFEAGYTSIDNIYGFDKVDVAHDMMLSEQKIPARGMVNNAYTATVTYNNINAAAEPADSYEVSLYVNGEKAATSDVKTEIAASGTASFELTMTPHETGTFPVYVEFKSIADGFTVKSDVVDVTIAEEQACKDYTVGEATDRGYEAPFYLYNADNLLGADDDVIYTADMLKAFGLKEGQKISSVTFSGNPSSDKDYSTFNLYACIGAVDVDDPTAYTPSEKEDGLEKIELYNDAAYSFKANEPFVTKFELTEPIVWDGVKAIRVRTHAQSNTYVKVYYDYDKNYKTAYYKKTSATSFSNCYTPVATFGVTADPVTVSGKVACGETPVANATVKLTSGNVYYTAQTAEDGTYSMSVFQSDKQYVVTATADGYDEYAETEAVDVTSGLTKDIQLVKSTVSVSGSVTYRTAALPGVKVTLANDDMQFEATTGEDGKFEFAAVPHDKALTLKAVCDKYNDYESAEPLSFSENTVLDAIEMTKPNAKVTGVVRCGDEIIAGAVVEYMSKNPYGLSGSITTDAEGKFETELPQDVKYMLEVEAAGYEPYALADSVEIAGDHDFGTIELKPLTVSIAMPETGWLAYSSDKALDFSTSEGLKAYTVSGVKMKNDAAYVELAEVTKVPANTGVLLMAVGGDYTVRQILEADAVETNLLVATADGAYTSKADEKNSVWTVGKTDNDVVAFATADEVEVPQGSAYLRFTADVPYIYLDENDVPEVDGISNISSDSMLDVNATMYNLAGQKVGKDYRGVVIQNGKKYMKK